MPKANEANYLLYLASAKQERTSDGLDQKKIANVAIAVPPVVPVLPAHSPWLVMLLGLFGATALSVGAAYFVANISIRRSGRRKKSCKL